MNDLTSIYHEKLAFILRNEILFSLPEMLRELRRSLGINAHRISKECGVNRHVLIRLEKGRFKRFPQDDRLYRIAKFYKVPYPIIERKYLEYLKDDTQCQAVMNLMKKKESLGSGALSVFSMREIINTTKRQRTKDT